MNNEIGKICAEGFSFFSKTNRLISHELKNILAIISETLGLLDELVVLSEKGTELKPERLRSMSDSVIEEVERANRVVKNMNTFAHSVDEFTGEVELNKSMSLVIALLKLNPVSRTVEIDFSESDAYIIYTSSFFLENFLYHLILFAMTAAGPDKHIQISLHTDGNEIRVTFLGIDPARLNDFPTPQAVVLSKAIGAEISSDISSGAFHIVLPKKMAGSPIDALLVK